MITIHVGLPKTGSTSIQLALKHSPTDPCTELVVPRPGESYTDEAWHRRISRIGNSNDVIFSHEGILGNPALGFPEIHSRLQSIRDAVRKRPSQMVIYLRPQLAWLTSLYLQGVQEGSIDSPERFWQKIRTAPLLRWKTLLETMQRESGVDHLVVRAYDPTRNVIDDFYGLLGLRDPSQLGLSNLYANATIKPVQAPLLIGVTKHGVHRGVASNRYREVFQNYLSHGLHATGSPFPDDVQMQILDRFKSDWDSVVEFVSSQDPIESERFAKIGVNWFHSKEVFVGSDLSAPAVQEEALRAIAELARLWNPIEPSVWKRLMIRVRHDPESVPIVIWRKLRRKIN